MAKAQICLECAHEYPRFDRVFWPPDRGFCSEECERSYGKDRRALPKTWKGSPLAPFAAEYFWLVDETFGPRISPEIKRAWAEHRRPEPYVRFGVNHMPTAAEINHRGGLERVPIPNFTFNLVEFFYPTESNWRGYVTAYGLTEHTAGDVQKFLAEAYQEEASIYAY